MKILIVDDNPDDRRLLRYGLEHYGCEVTDAVDGLEGLELARKHLPDVIISDALMPRMDGFKFLREIKQIGELKTIPFIFYTSTFVGAKEAELAISLGAEAYIVKPKAPQEFWDEVKSILQNMKAKKEKIITAEIIEEDNEFLRRYSEIVAEKLESKVRALEKTQAQLIATQERLDHLVSYSPSVIYSVDSSGWEVTFISGNIAVLLGYKVQEFKEDPHFRESHIHPDDLPRVRQEISVLREQGHYISEYRFRHKDGSYRWLRDEANTYSPSGDVLEIIGAIIDITERKNAEERMRESEYFLSESQQIASIGSWRADLTGRVVWSDETYRIYGVSPNTFTPSAESLINLLYPDDRPVMQAWISACVAGKKPGELDVRIILPDGSLRFIRGRGELKYDSENRPAYAAGTVQDITERKKAEQDIRLFQSLINQSNDSIEVLDSETGNFIFVNNKAYTDLGYSREELLSMKVFDIDPILMPSEFPKMVEELRMIGGRIWYGVHKRKDGSTFPVEVSVRLVQIDRSYLVAVVRDITERRKAEERIISLNRLYSVLSKVEEAVVHIREPEKLYQEVCRIIVEVGLFRMAWIGIVEPETLLVKPVAIYGHEDSYLKETHISVNESIPEGWGPTGIAIRTGGYFVCNDIENDPVMKPWRDEALKRGYRSSAAFALKKAGEIIGAISVYSGMAYFFQEEEEEEEEEVILFKSLAEDISYAIESIEIEMQRKQAREALKESEGKYRVLFETSLDGIYQTDANNVFVLINQAGADIFGYKTPDEIIGRPVIDFWGEPKDREVFFTRLKRTKHVESYPVAARKRDGETIHLEISSRILEDDYENFCGVEGIIRDVTKRKKAEEEINARIKELEDFYEMAVGRELKMKELKEETQKLKSEISKYKKDKGM